MTTTPATTTRYPVAVIGAGPVGLAAAAHLAARNEAFVVLEGGREAGEAMRQWGHVRLFSPWRFCVDREAARLLESTGWQRPDSEALPTGGELVERYLAPLAAHPAIAPHVRYGARVVSVGRHGLDKLQSAGRESRPFEIRLDDGSTVLARAVIDASGTWAQPNPMGAGGRFAAGEAGTAGIAYGLPDIEGAERGQYAGRTTLVVGSGHSAINNVLSLLALRDDAPGTRVTWAMRRAQVESVYGGEESDALPARGALGSRARAAVESGQLTLLAPFHVRSVTRDGDAMTVAGDLGETPHEVTVDRVIVATGFRPDLEMLREVRLALDPALESSATLGPLIDPNLHSCGTVPPHGARQLAHPEPDFYIIGNKSYGRAPTFLMATGFEQARSVVARLAGDFEAAARVELVLPETGVCSSDSGGGGDACCGTAPASVISLESIGDAPAAQSSSCCGGPAPAGANACCALDAEAKSAGEAGCGCGTATPEPATAGVG